MRIRFAVLGLVLAAAGAWAAQPSDTAPYEIVKDHVEIDIAADGSDASSREEIYKVIDSRGIDLLHERRIGYSQRYESMQVMAAYTLKANGQRIDVPRSGFLSGYGQTSQPGFQDNVVLSIFYPNLEVGDSVVLVTVHRQTTPWFAGKFDYRKEYSRTVIARDVSIAITAPTSLALKFDQSGLTAAPPRVTGERTRWSWEFRNDAPVIAERDAVSESDFAPHLAVTSFADYAEVARAYGDRSKDTSTVTPEIAALAEQLTKGVADRRQQTKILYDWVSAHIAYVQIVLGAGGFTPHPAKDVLANRYGDCKDHVVLLEALLKAKGIPSSSVLIRAGDRSYVLSPAAMPHAFDHAITYVPEFDLYLDSTAQLAPFGVLPYSDAGKPVLKITTGEVGHTPVTKPAASTIRTTGEVVIDKDGNAKADVTITSTGAIAVEVRDAMRDTQSAGDLKFLSDRVGPGVEGTLDRGDPHSLAEPYVVKAHYRVPGAISVPGPGALPTSLALRLFSFMQMIAADLPASRNSDYVCAALTADQEIKYVFPEGYRLLSIPDSRVFTTDGVRLQLDFDRTDPRTLKMKASLRLEHPEATCTPAYYAKTRASLSKMVNALKEQIIYRGPKEAEQ